MSSPRRVAANTATFSASFPVVVDVAKAAGFSGLEVWKTDVEALPGGAVEAATILGKAGIEAPTFQLLRDYEGCGSDRSERLTEAEELMGLMVDVGAQTLLICANTDPTSSGDRSQQIRDLKLLADMAQARDLQIGFEPLAWSRWVNDYELAWACVDAVNHPSFGLVLDVFHLFSRKTPLTVLNKIAMDKLFVVQLSNAVSMPLPTIEIARHHRLLPADGEWPVGKVVRHLEALGFTGDYSLEIFNDEYKKLDPFEMAKAALDSFRQLFAVDEGVAETEKLEFHI